MAELKPYKPTWERIEFGGRIGLGGVMGYALGKGGQLALVLYDKVTDLYNVVIIPSAAKADEKATQVIESLPGGKTAIEADRQMSGFWERLFGRTPENQREWRQQHGLEQRTETEQPQTEQPAYKTETQEPYQPPQVQNSRLADSYGDPIVAIATTLGAAYGAAKGASRYLSARRQAAIINSNRTIQAKLADLEKLLKQRGEQTGQKS